MGRSSPYRHLRVLTDAGIEVASKCRPNIADFLAVGFESDEARCEWLRQAVFAVRVRDVGNPGAYIKTLADKHTHRVLSARERRQYDEAVRRGFGRDGWNPADFLAPSGRGGGRG